MNERHEEAMDGPGCVLQAVPLACALLLAAGAAHAQIQVPSAHQPGLDTGERHVRSANVTVVPRDAKTATVQFDIAWDDSWRHEPTTTRPGCSSRCGPRARRSGSTSGWRRTRC